jgi:hypothetical protein
MRNSILGFGDDFHLGESDLDTEHIALHACGGVAKFIEKNPLSPIQNVRF